MTLKDVKREIKVKGNGCYLSGRRWVKRYGKESSAVIEDAGDCKRIKGDRPSQWWAAVWIVVIRGGPCSGKPGFLAVVVNTGVEMSVKP